METSQVFNLEMVGESILFCLQIGSVLNTSKGKKIVRTQFLKGGVYVITLEFSIQIIVMFIQ